MTSVFDRSPTATCRRGRGPSARRPRRRTAAGAALIAVLSVGLTVTFADTARAAAIPLGATDGFAVLAGTGITNTGATVITGDIGSYPTNSISGTGTMVLNGTNHGNDGVAQQAQTDLVAAYDDLEGAGPSTPIAAGELGGGETLTAGVYNSGAFAIDLSGSLTLNGGGNPDAVFIFQSPSALTTASGSSVTLTNGAQACNVFWQVTSSASLGTTTAFKGTIVALTSIDLTTGATVDGRLLARNGAVTLQANTITRSVCAPPAAPPGSGGGTPDGGTGGTGGTGGSGQIQRVPVGSVDTGDGSLVAVSRLRSWGVGFPTA